jgi:hypothetical protein
VASALKRPGFSSVSTPHPDGGYAARANSSLDTYNAELPVPATNYANSSSALSDHLGEQHATISNRNAAFVSAIPRMVGLVFNWAWGANDMGAFTESLPHASGVSPMVRNTWFQRTLVQLHDWQINRRWYIAAPMGGAVFMGGNPVRSTYPSFRTEQISVNTSGGVGPASMGPRNRYTAVQQVPKYNTAPRYYSTASRMTGGNRSGSSSNVNGPGV